MTLRLYYHPLSSFCQKVLIALYENGTAFEAKFTDLGDEQSRSELAALWPMAKFPLLHDMARDVVVPETSLIIDYLARHYAGPVRLMPDDPDLALRAQILDRVMDNYVSTQLTKIVIDEFRPDGQRDLIGVDQARATINQAYATIEQMLADDGWAAGADFSIADCAAAPALFYSNIAVPFGPNVKLAAYYERLRARPSFARAVDEARPYRHLFPLPWPPAYD